MGDRRTVLSPGYPGRHRRPGRRPQAAPQVLVDRPRFGFDRIDELRCEALHDSLLARAHELERELSVDGITGDERRLARAHALEARRRERMVERLGGEIETELSAERAQLLPRARDQGLIERHEHRLLRGAVVDQPGAHVPDPAIDPLRPAEELRHALARTQLAPEVKITP